MGELGVAVGSDVSLAILILPALDVFLVALADDAADHDRDFDHNNDDDNKINLYLTI